MYKIKVVYKFCLVVMLVAGLGCLAFSGYKFINGEYTRVLLNAHKFIGFGLILIAVLHIVIKRRKLVKLVTETIDIVFKHKSPALCNMERLTGAFENHTLKSVCELLNLELEETLNTLRKNGVNFKDEHQTMHKISKLNDEKMFFVLVVILEKRLSRS